MKEKMGIYGGIHRRLYSVRVCGNCTNDVWRTKTDTGSAKYCSRSCTVASQTRRVELRCHRCNALFSRTEKKSRKNKSGIVFCSRPCKDGSQRVDGILVPAHYGTGVTDYRSRALKHYGRFCAKCGYTEDVRMIDVHHTDRNRRNNAIGNLEVLCVWCHALETRKDWPVR